MRLDGLLAPDRHRALVERIDEIVARFDPSGSPADVDAELEDGWHALVDALSSVAGLARRELGLAHFVVDGAAGVLHAHRDGRSFPVATFGPSGSGSRQLDFVYTLSPGGPTPDGADDNSVVLSAPDGAGGAAPLRASAAAPRYSVSGWLTGEPHAPS